MARAGRSSLLLPKTPVLVRNAPVLNFGTTPVIDTLDYASSGLTGNGDWNGPLAAFSSGARVGDVPGKVSPTQATDGNYTNTLYGPDCEAYFTLSQIDVTTPAQQVRVRIKIHNPTLGSTAGQTYYETVINGSGSMELRYGDGAAGSPHTVNTATLSITAGDKIGCQVVGTVFSSWWYDSVKGLWKLVGWDVDDYGTAGAPAVANTAGNLALVIQGSATSQQWNIDDFGGGTLPYVPPASGDVWPEYVNGGYY